MLFSLYVKNFALIQELTVEFSPGLTIITGETGAGKSILIGALNLVLGDRASSDLVRSGTSKAVIEAVLKEVICEKIVRLLNDANIEIAPELILRREISSNGQSRCFINDTPCTAALLKKAGEELIDLHGQHEHQLLLHADTHETMLDDYALTAGDVIAYQTYRATLQGLLQQVHALKQEAASLQEKKEILDLQLTELNGVELKSDEAGCIEEEIIILENAETLYTLSSTLNDLLYESEHYLYSGITAALHTLEKLAAIDKRFDIHLQESRTATTIIDELSRFTRSYASGIDFHPQRLDTLRERQLQLQRLCKKYQRTVDGLIELRNELESKSALEEQLDERLDLLEQKVMICKLELSRRAATLSAKRQEAARRLEPAIQEQLAELGIPNATFIVSMTHEAQPEGDISLDGSTFTAYSRGYDKIEFLISTNSGEKPRPLIKVASGGEISRVMLAMKSVLAESTNLPILIFDEIDTGISGRVAEAVGKSLRKLSRLHQIIAITHLPQIAAMADLHLGVKKSLQLDRTVTEVTPLDQESRLQAIASLISGEQISVSSLTLAAELVGTARN